MTGDSSLFSRVVIGRTLARLYVRKKGVMNQTNTRKSRNFGRITMAAAAAFVLTIGSSPVFAQRGGGAVGHVGGGMGCRHAMGGGHPSGVGRPMSGGQPAGGGRPTAGAQPAGS